MGNPSITNRPATGGCPFHAGSGPDFGPQLKEAIGAVMAKGVPFDRASASSDPQHLLGQLYFHLERWGDAEKQLTSFVAKNPTNTDAAALLDRARSNIATRPDVHTGPTEGPSVQTLLDPPVLHMRAPEGMERQPEPHRSFGDRVTDVFTRVTGKLLGGAAEAAVQVAGNTGKTKDAWTNWDDSHGLIAPLKLAKIRHDLNDKDNRIMQSTYKGGLVGFQQPMQRRPEWTERVRTATGAWTTDDPMEGAAHTEFQVQGGQLENQVNRAEDPSLPNPRDVSRVLLTSIQGQRKEAPFLNNFAAAWIQFQTHDWVSHAPSLQDGHYEIPLSKDDPFRARFGLESLQIPKTSSNPLASDGRPAFQNEVTHWWDLSPVYGSDQATQDRIRQGADGQILADGKLRIDGDFLPVNPDTGVEDTGFSRNWWVGLSLFHTLYTKHHNFICDELKKANPTWGSDQLFHTARLVNAAINAKIHTVEWTPAVLPNKTLAKGMGANWWGLAETSLKPFDDRRVGRKLEPKHEILGGLVGGDRDNHGAPYGFSEKFVEVYRPLHVAMTDQLDILPVGEHSPTEHIGTEQTRGPQARAVLEEHGVETVLNSFLHQKMGALVSNNYPKFMQEISFAGQPITDLGAIDILRARERGVPQYNEFRRQLGLTPLESFEELKCDKATIAKLKEVYGDGPDAIEKLDLLVGVLAEGERPEFFGFGETMFQVFIQMASRRLQADPFYTEKFTEEFYTKEGLALIEGATMKNILVQHYPALAETLKDQHNAFEPAGTTAKTHPAEHPLGAGNERY